MLNKVILSAAAASLFAACVSAICPGYDYGIAQSSTGVFQVFDGSCNTIQQVISQNPCNGGVLDCTSAPNFTGLHLDGVKYACSPDTSGDSCNGHAIQVCCLNKKSEDDKKPKNPNSNPNSNPHKF